MPLYQYGCATCGAQLERRQRFNDPALTECPSCRGRLVRMIQPPGIIFKGTGWYCTDHRPKPEAAKSGATGRASSSSAKETTGKSEKATASATT